MHSGKEEVKRSEANDGVNSEYSALETNKEETNTHLNHVNTPKTESNSRTDVPVTTEMSVKQNDDEALVPLRSNLKQIESTSVEIKDHFVPQNRNSGAVLIGLGIALIVIGALVSAFIFALGGELLGLIGAIGIIIGVISLYIGLRRRKDSASTRTRNRNGKINLFALFAWILLPVCFFGALGIVAGPVILAFLIVATIQFKRNPEKFKGRWMVDILWILIIAAALVYATTALLVVLFW